MSQRCGSQQVIEYHLTLLRNIFGNPVLGLLSLCSRICSQQPKLEAFKGLLLSDYYLTFNNLLLELAISQITQNDLRSGGHAQEVCLKRSFSQYFSISV